MAFSFLKFKYFILERYYDYIWSNFSSEVDS